MTFTDPDTMYPVTPTDHEIADIRRTSGLPAHISDETLRQVIIDARARLALRNPDQCAALADAAFQKGWDAHTESVADDQAGTPDAALELMGAKLSAEIARSHERFDALDNALTRIASELDFDACLRAQPGPPSFEEGSTAAAEVTEAFRRGVTVGREEAATIPLDAPADETAELVTGTDRRRSPDYRQGMADGLTRAHMITAATINERNDGGAVHEDVPPSEYEVWRDALMLAATATRSPSPDVVITSAVDYLGALRSRVVHDTEPAAARPYRAHLVVACDGCGATMDPDALNVQHSAGCHFDSATGRLVADAYTRGVGCPFCTTVHPADAKCAPPF